MMYQTVYLYHQRFFSVLRINKAQNLYRNEYLQFFYEIKYVRVFKEAKIQHLQQLSGRQINYISRDAKILEKCIKQFTEDTVQIDLKYLLRSPPQAVTQRLISSNLQNIKEGKIFPELRAMSDHHQLLSRHVVFLLQFKQKSKQQSQNFTDFTQPKALPFNYFWGSSSACPQSKCVTVSNSQHKAADPFLEVYGFTTDSPAKNVILSQDALLGLPRASTSV